MTFWGSKRTSPTQTGARDSRTGGADLVLTLADTTASGVSLVFACADIDRSLRAVTEAGLAITHPLEEGHWGAKIAGFEDPEGNTIYLEQPNPNAQWGH